MFNESFFEKKPEDKSGIFFTEEIYDIASDGTKDVSLELQKAVKDVVKANGCGIVFVPEGTYLVSQTIMIPRGVRIIGYGKNRPVFILADNAPGFDKPNETAKGGYNYLFWFVSEIVEPMEEAYDANPGTFYSAISNVDINLGSGNEYAVALRTHYAQNSVVSHMHIEVNSGMAAIYDVGNFAADVSINGGKYGIISTKCSPGWPFVMTDFRFANQSVAAIYSREVGFSILRTYAVNTPKFLEVMDGFFEKVFIEDCVFEDMNSVLNIAMDENSLTQINIVNTFLKEVESVVEYKDTGRVVPNEDNQCKIRKYIHGTTLSDMFPEKQVHDQIYRYALNVDYSILENKQMSVPSMDKWVNAADLGLVGDEKKDNSDALEAALKEHKHIYFPQGIYVFSRPIVLPKGASLIGLNSGTTRLGIRDNNECFAGFGDMKGFITAEGSNVITGIAIDAGARNPRACALDWVGTDGLVNDVKFYGGHGSVEPGTGAHVIPYSVGRMSDANPERTWDGQYPSLVIRNGGGGVFQNIWTASTYASAGIYIKDTSTPITMYAISLEHHQRCEMKLDNVENASLYGIQFEEEKAEGEFALPIEMYNCNNVRFNTVYFFRTVFVEKPMEYCIKTYNCSNIRFYNVHNFTQMKYTIANLLLDVNTHTAIRPWQAALVEVSGKAKKTRDLKAEVESAIRPVKLYDGFRFADGGFASNKGDFYFVDSLDKRLYKIDKTTFELSVVFESPYKIDSVGFDTEDNIIVVGEYSVPVGATINGAEIEEVIRPEDSHGSSFHDWYDQRVMPVVFTVNKGCITKLEKIDIGSIKPTRVLYSGNRWRDGNDVKQMLEYNPKKAYLAPDGVTIIPDQFDLIRATNLTKSKPGRKLYSVDELYNRVYMATVGEDGLLTDPKVIIEEGTYRVKKHNELIYVGDDQIKVYKDGKKQRSIELPTRPHTFDFGGNNKGIMFITTRDAVYAIKE